MSNPQSTEAGRIAAQRFKESAFNKPIKSPLDNAKRQQKALKGMSLLELHCGITHEQFDAWAADQRARVRARWGRTA